MGSLKQKYLLTIHNEKNNQRNKLLERAKPLRPVAPLSAQAKVKLSFGGNLTLVFPCFYDISQTMHQSLGIQVDFDEIYRVTYSPSLK